MERGYTYSKGWIYIDQKHPSKPTNLIHAYTCDPLVFLEKGNVDFDIRQFGGLWWSRRICGGVFQANLGRKGLGF